MTRRLSVQLELSARAQAVQGLREHSGRKTQAVSGCRVVQAVLTHGTSFGASLAPDVAQALFRRLLFRSLPLIRGHNENRVFEIHSPTMAVGQSTIVEYLQQDIKNIGMRLLNLI